MKLSGTKRRFVPTTPLAMAIGNFKKSEEEI
jgi:hypothetical protein